MSRQITVRGLSDELGLRLASLGRERGQSVNTTVLGILENAVGIEARRGRLERYATWSAADVAGFDRALASQRRN